MNSVLNEMLKLLSDEDKKAFVQLSEKLQSIDGDISRLSKEEQELIRLMEKKYGDKINQTHQAFTSSEESIEILDVPFAQHVRQILARDLGEQFPEEEAAVQFVFENKWLPVDCQDESLVQDLFQRFEQDICEANQWREEMVGIESDKKMAVGLAWFMVIFKLNERLNG